MNRIISAAIAAGLLLALPACKTTPKWNDPLQSAEPGYGYRFENLEHPGNSDELFVILTFSGGGTRAAALSYGVLEALEDTQIALDGGTRSLLDEVDVISSVSGGSLTAAYYGLYREGIFDDYTERVLYRDVQGEFLGLLTNVKNAVRLASPFYGRTDLLAEQFNEQFFARQTYADIMDPATRPFVILNATDLALGQPFRFTQPQFSLLGSDLTSYPVGNAVAASAAYPGLLTPVRLRNYALADRGGAGAEGTRIQRPTDSASKAKAPPLTTVDYQHAERRYIHLADGGISDNLGLMPAIEALRGESLSLDLMPLIEAGEIEKVVVIAVNAQRDIYTDWGEHPEVVGLLSVLGVVSTIPIGNFTQAQLDLMRLIIEEREEDQRLVAAVEELLGPEAAAELPFDNPVYPVDYHLVEVAFDQLEDEEERRYFQTIPTAFRLPEENVTRLREVAQQILTRNQAFQDLLLELR